MTAMDHFAIEDISHHDRFQYLAVESENMDKKDFIEGSYPVDEDLHPRVVLKPSPKSKSKASGSKASMKRDRSADEEEEEANRGEDEDEEEESPDDGFETEDEQEGWQDPITSIHLGDSRNENALAKGAQTSAAGGSSTARDENTTPASGERQPKKKPRKAPEVKQTDTQMLMQMFLDNQSEQKKVQEENKNFFHNLLTNVVPTMCKEVAKEVVSEYHAIHHVSPLSAIEPPPVGSQPLLISAAPHASGSSEKPLHQSHENPTASGGLSIPDNQTQDSGVEVTDMEIRHVHDVPAADTTSQVDADSRALNDEQPGGSK